MINEPLHKKTSNLHNYEKTKAQISFTVTVKLISAFFATHIDSNSSSTYTQIFKHLAFFFDCTARFVSDLVGNSYCWLSHTQAQIKNKFICVCFYFSLLSSMTRTIIYEPVRERTNNLDSDQV